jgi:hypothetical protein
LFSIEVRRFDPQRLARQTLERRRVPRGGPHLELRIARGAQLQQIVVAAIMQFETSDDL